MTGDRSRLTWKSTTALVCAVLFLLFAQGSVTRALAADPTPPAKEPAPAQTWETWPKKTVAPGVEKPTPPETGAAAAGAAGGTKTSAGLSAGTIGWILLGVGAAIAIGVAAGGGGGGGGGGTSTTPAHP